MCIQYALVGYGIGLGVVYIIRLGLRRLPPKNEPICRLYMQY